MFRKYLLLLAVLPILLLSREVSTFSGKAYNDKKELLFTEEYSVEKEGNTILSVTTKFISPDGLPLAEMSSNFSEGSYLPSVLFTKENSKHSYGLQFLNETIELFKTTTSLQAKKHKTLSIEKNMVAGHGFYFYILSKLDSLLSGSPHQLVFLQPNRLSFYTFNMKASSMKENPSLVKVSLSIESRLLKAFVSDIHLVLHKETGALVSYEGLSGFFPFDDGSLKKICVTYTQPTTTSLCSEKI